MNNRYRIRMKSDVIAHKGTKGMKWGYTDGKPNGKRKAAETDSLFDEVTTVKRYAHIHTSDGKKKVVESEERVVKKGKISRAVDSGKKKIKNFFKSGKKAISKFSKGVVSKGKKKVASLLKKLK